MKEIVINKARLKEDEITEVLDKARIVLRNDEGEFILSHFERVYFLPGGKVELTETPVDAVKRELKEETNINILLDDIEPFVLVKNYLRDYESSDGTIVNRLVNTYYFTGFTSKEDIEYFYLTMPEKRDDLRAFFIDMEEARELLKEYNKDNPKATYLALETIKVLDEYETLNLD
jgi:ADP-ribose pyrophosphatase YjhB (NUDIX family)